MLTKRQELKNIYKKKERERKKETTDLTCINGIYGAIQ